MLGKDIFGKAARFGEGARDLMGSMAGEVERLVKVRVEAQLKKMNLVSREEFEAVKTLAEQARAKVDALEQRLGKQQGNAASAPPKGNLSPRRKSPNPDPKARF